MNIRNRHLSRQEIVLNNDVVNFLGPDLVLDDCQVMSNTTGEGLAIVGLTMSRGVFRQKRALRNFHFANAHFRDVSFLGTYSGCDFGDWETPAKSSIQSCDFSSASLDGCRFLLCNPESLRFPGWPCFALLDPSAASPYVLAQTWPGSLGTLLDIYTDVDPACVAVVGDANNIATEYKLPLENLRSLLLHIPGILIAQ